MALRDNKRGASSEVLKIALAMVLAFAVFAMLANLALGPKAAGTAAEQIGAGMLDLTQETALQILDYGNNTTTAAE